MMELVLRHDSQGNEYYEAETPVRMTADEFMQRIYDKKLDVTVAAVGDYPYTSVFKFRNGNIYGWIEPNSVAYVHAEYLRAKKKRSKCPQILFKF